ncbi:unnamed protein product [Rhizophagus irregularis]|nr:unnamed protein product [Rhizophagus irregularis]
MESGTLISMAKERAELETKEKIRRSFSFIIFLDIFLNKPFDFFRSMGFFLILQVFGWKRGEWLKSFPQVTLERSNVRNHTSRWDNFYVIEILDEEVYDANKDTQNIQILPINSDSSSDNETKMAYFTKNLVYKGWKDHMDAFNDIQYSIGGGGGSPIQKCPFFGDISVTKIYFESNIYKQINKNNNRNDKEHCTYTIFLAAQIRIVNLSKMPQEKWHRYIVVDTQQIDIDLLRKLFNGEAIMEKNIDQCSTIISKSSRTKKCAYIHYCNGSVYTRQIVDKPCNVKMYKFIPNDLQECSICCACLCWDSQPPPPPPERTSPITSKIIYNQ